MKNFAAQAERYERRASAKALWKLSTANFNAENETRQKLNLPPNGWPNLN